MRHPYCLVCLALPVLLLTGCETTSPPTIYTPEPYITPEPSARDFYEQGRERYDRADYQGALDDFKRAVDRNPDYAEAYFGMGNAYRKLNANEQAIRAYQDCLRIQPHHADAHLNVGLLFSERFQYVPAESHLKQAIADDPSNPVSYFYLAEIYRKQGQCSEPIELYNKVLKMDPDFHDARASLKEVKARNCASKKPKPAEPVYKKVAPGSGLQGGGKALQPHEW